jgi:hypothetical protein
MSPSYAAAVMVLMVSITLANSKPCVGIEAGLLTWDAQNYVVFAGSGYTFAGADSSTTLKGDIGSYPTASPLNGNSKVILNGLEKLDTTYTKIVAQDLGSMRFNGFAKPNRKTAAAEIGGSTLSSGVYFAATSIAVTGTMILDGGGNAESVFVIVAGSTITTAASSSVLLRNSAQACHVYWFAGSSATLGVGSLFVGTVNANVSISVSSGSDITGRLFAAQAITIDNSVVTLPDCRPTLADMEYCGSSTASVSISTFIAALFLTSIVKKD